MVLKTCLAVNVSSFRGPGKKYWPLKQAHLLIQPACLISPPALSACLVLCLLLGLSFVELNFLQTNMPWKSTLLRYLWLEQNKTCFSYN